MDPACLVFSAHNDMNLVAATWALAKSGVRVLSGSSLTELPLRRLSIRVSADGPDVLTAFPDLDIRSVWCHRPRNPEAPAGMGPEDAEFVRTEWRLFQKNLLALGGHVVPALWVNDPTRADEAEHKIVQLRAARELGIRCPPTLFSNDPSAVRAFARRHGRIVYKHFFPHAWRDAASGRYLCSEVAVLDDPASIDDASLALCPGIYQPYIEKTCDVRVTCIGDRMFPVSIRSHAGRAFVDWRPYSDTAELSAERCALPAHYEAKLMALMRRLGLVHGCIDLVLDASGEPYFLEVNPSGQFLFVEQWLPELPLLQAMCAMLAQGRVDYALADAPPVSFAAFQRTDVFEQFRVSQRQLVENAMAAP